MVEWWGTRRQISPRLWLEVRVMREMFGSTFRLVVPEEGDVYWLGAVEINLSTVSSPWHTLKIVYPEAFPHMPPVVFPVDPEIRSPKHQYTNNQLCLFNPQDGADYGWNPARSTAATVAAWAIEWLYAYYTHQATGVWPGLEESVSDHTRLTRRPRAG